MPWSCKPACEMQTGAWEEGKLAASQLVFNADVCSFLPLVLNVPGCGKSIFSVSLACTNHPHTSLLTAWLNLNTFGQVNIWYKEQESCFDFFWETSFISWAKCCLFQLPELQKRRKKEKSIIFMHTIFLQKSRGCNLEALYIHKTDMNST